MHACSSRAIYMHSRASGQKPINFGVLCSWQKENLFFSTYFLLDMPSVCYSMVQCDKEHLIMSLFLSQCNKVLSQLVFNKKFMWMITRFRITLGRELLCYCSVRGYIELCCICKWQFVYLHFQYNPTILYVI